MKTDLHSHDDPKSNDFSKRPTSNEVVERLDALWTEEQDHTKSRLPAFLPDRIGRYVIKELVGRGSFGLVCLASDELLNRDVALKIPRPEVLEDDERMSRFESEARIAARLDHPGIVPLYEADLKGEHPFLASAYCPGCDLGQWLERRRTPVPIVDAVKLVLQLAEAIQYAHQQGVVHRDLKPTNILLHSGDIEDAFPLALNEVSARITDFGLAKSLGSELVDTRSSMMVGTPLYMAPEQVERGSIDSSQPSSDIYALGCILYELIAGRTPIVGDTYVEVVDGLRHATPPKLRTLRPEVSRDLENICGKCLEKQPSDRYESVCDLANDLQRLLNGEEVLARPIPAARRVYRSLVKRPLLSALAMLVAISLFSSAAIAYRYFNDIGEFEKSLQTVSHEAQRSKTVADELNNSLANIQNAECLAAAFDAFENSDHVGAIARLAEYDPAKHGPKTFGWHALKSLTDYPEPLVLKGHEGPVREVAKIPNSSLLASVGDDGTIRLWDYNTGRLVDTFSASDRQLSSLAISPDGSTIATGNTSLALWNIDERKARPLGVAFDTTIEEVAFSEDGRFIACGARNRGIKVFSLDSSTHIEIDSDSGNESLFIQDDKIYGIHSPTSTRHLYSWDLETGQEEDFFRAPIKTAVGLAALSSNQTRLAIGNLHAGEVVMIDSNDGTEIWRSAKKPEAYGDLTFTPDDAFLIAGRRDGALRCWNLEKRLDKSGSTSVLDPINSAIEIPAHQRRITSLCCIDNRRFATSSEDGSIKIWSLPQKRHRLTYLAPEVHEVDAIPESDDMVMVSTNRDIKRYDASAASTIWHVDYPRKQIPNNRRRGKLRLSGSGRLTAAYGLDYYIDVYDTNTGKDLLAFQLPNTAKSIDFSPDERLLAATGVDGFTSVWDLSSGKKVFRHKLTGWGLSARFSPDGEYLAVGGRVADTVLFDTKHWTMHGKLSASSGVTSLAFDPVKEEIATAHRDGVIRLWNTTTCDFVTQFIDDSRMTSLAYHPSDGTLASGSGGGIILWDTRTRRRLGTVWPKKDAVQAALLEFTQSGNQLNCLLQKFIKSTRANGLLVIDVSDQ